MALTWGRATAVEDTDKLLNYSRKDHQQLDHDRRKLPVISSLDASYEPLGIWEENVC